MYPLLVNIKINDKIYVRDPRKTNLGRKIIEHSVLLIDELGLEQFTFKKLGASIGSTEGSIYRYFENKHKLFVYLLNWYWEWMIVRIDLNTLNITDPNQKLKIIIDVIADTAIRNTEIEFVNEEILHRIVVTEGAKGYHHKLVDEDNEEQFFHSYKRLCERIVNVIIEIQPQFRYAKSMASMLVESANNNIYFAQHLPRLSDLSKGEYLQDHLKQMLYFFALQLLRNPSTNVLSTMSKEEWKTYDSFY